MGNIFRLAFVLFGVLFISNTSFAAMTLAQFKAKVLASPKYNYAYSTKKDECSLPITGNYIPHASNGVFSDLVTPMFRAVASTFVSGNESYRHLVAPRPINEGTYFLDANGTVYRPRYGQLSYSGINHNGIDYGRITVGATYDDVYRGGSITVTGADRTSDRFYAARELVTFREFGGQGHHFLDPEYADFEINLYAYDQRGDRLNVDGIGEFLMRTDDANGLEEFYLGRRDQRGVAMVMYKRSTKEFAVHFIPGTGHRVGDNDFTTCQIPMLSPATKAEKIELERNGTWQVLSYSWLMEAEYQATFTLDDVKTDFENAPCYWFNFKVTNDNNYSFADVNLRDTQIVPAKALGNVPVGIVGWARALDRDVGNSSDIIVNHPINVSGISQLDRFIYGVIDNGGSTDVIGISGTLKLPLIKSGFNVDYSDDIGIKVGAVDVGRVVGLGGLSGGNWFGDVTYLKYRIVIFDKKMYADLDSGVLAASTTNLLACRFLLTFEPKYVRVDGSHAFTVYFKLKIPDRIRSQVFGAEWEKFLTPCTDDVTPDPPDGPDPPPPPVDPGCCICGACCKCKCFCGKWDNCGGACSGNCKDADPLGCGCHCENPPPPPPPVGCCDCGACCSCRCTCGKWLQCGAQCNGSCITDVPGGCACHCQTITDYTGCICGAGCEHCCKCRDPVTKTGWSVMKDGGGFFCTEMGIDVCVGHPHSTNVNRPHDHDGDGAQDHSFCCKCHNKGGGTPPSGPVDVNWPDPFDPNVDVPPLDLTNPPLVQLPGWNIPFTPITVPQWVFDGFSQRKERFKQFVPADIFRNKIHRGQGTLPILDIQCPNFFGLNMSSWRYTYDFNQIAQQAWVPLFRRICSVVLLFIFFGAIIHTLRQY